MKIVIGKHRLTIDDDDFRRILSSADGDLRKLKSTEGRMFPKSDERALVLILDLFWRLSEKSILKTEDADG